MSSLGRKLFEFQTKDWLGSSIFVWKGFPFLKRGESPRLFEGVFIVFSLVACFDDLLVESDVSGGFMVGRWVFVAEENTNLWYGVVLLEDCLTSTLGSEGFEGKVQAIDVDINSGCLNKQLVVVERTQSLSLLKKIIVGVKAALKVFEVLSYRKWESYIGQGFMNGCIGRVNSFPTLMKAVNTIGIKLQWSWEFCWVIRITGLVMAYQVTNDVDSLCEIIVFKAANGRFEIVPGLDTTSRAVFAVFGSVSCWVVLIILIILDVFVSIAGVKSCGLVLLLPVSAEFFRLPVLLDCSNLKMAWFCQDKGEETAQMRRLVDYRDHRIVKVNGCCASLSGLIMAQFVCPWMVSCAYNLNCYEDYYISCSSSVVVLMPVSCLVYFGHLVCKIGKSLLGSYLSRLCCDCAWFKQFTVLTLEQSSKDFCLMGVQVRMLKPLAEHTELMKMGAGLCVLIM